MNPDIAEAESLRRRLKNSDGRMRVVRAVALVAWAAGLFTYLVLSQAETDSNRPIALLALWFAIGAIATVIELVNWARPRPSVIGAEALAIEAEHLARREMRELTSLPLVLLIFGGLAGWAAYDAMGRRAEDAEVGPIIMFTTIWVITAARVLKLGLTPVGRPTLDGELVRANRDAALRTGFVTLAVSVAAAFMTGVWRPQLGIAGLPLALSFGLSIVCIRFVMLERRAGEPQ